MRISHIAFFLCALCLSLATLAMEQQKIFTTRKGPVYFSKNNIRFVLFARINSTIKNIDVSDDDLITMGSFWIEKIAVQPFDQNGVSIKIDLNIMTRAYYNFLVATEGS